MNDVVKKSWAELATLYGVFSTTAQIIARRKYPKGSISIEFDFDEGEAIAEIYYRQDSDYLRITLDELAQELSKAGNET